MFSYLVLCMLLFLNYRLKQNSKTKPLPSFRKLLINPQPLPKRVMQKLRLIVSSFNFQHSTISGYELHKRILYVLSVGNTTTFWSRKMELIPRSETSTHLIQTPGIYPKENTLHNNVVLATVYSVLQY
jgi:hypothetical protein